tara:strand:- start:3296 stop:3784 length:489 start_codon:yes stop_codon:yes gene_type:complete
MSSEQETNSPQDTKKGKIINMKPIEVTPITEELTADGDKILPYITLNITPVSKPRMTQSDKWKKRPATTKYWKYKENLKLLCFICRWQPKENLDIQFVIPMPISWSGKKKEKYDGQPHKQRPDLDNLVKAFKDALLIEDSHVHTYGNITKKWGKEGKIILKR